MMTNGGKRRKLQEPEGEKKEEDMWRRPGVGTDFLSNVQESSLQPIDGYQDQ